jgi:hypothetical protein
MVNTTLRVLLPGSERNWPELREFPAKLCRLCAKVQGNKLKRTDVEMCNKFRLLWLIELSLIYDAPEGRHPITGFDDRIFTTTATEY